MSRRPSMVVFDLGGVLVRICRSWKEACNAAGEPYHEGITDPAAMARRKALVRQYEIGAMTCDEFFAAVADSTEGLYTAEQVRRVHNAWLLGEYPRVAELVPVLHRAGLATGVLSNTNHAHWRAMTDLASASYPALASVQHPHASHLLGHAKPSVDIYRVFAQRVGFSATGLLFFDDLPDNVAAAREAGWDAVLIDHAGDTAAQIRAALVERSALP